MKTITLHSNSKQTIHDAATLLGIGFSLEYIEISFRWAVCYSFGSRVTEDAARDYRYHETVTLS